MDNEREARSARSFIGSVSTVFFVLSLAMFGLFVFRSSVEAYGSIWGALKHHDQAHIVWMPLELEKRQYLAHGYDLSWLNQSPLRELRACFDPYFGFFDLALIRLVGLFQTWPYFVTVLAVAIFEGRIRYHEKVEDFENISATKFHLLRNMFFLFSLTSIYLSYPFGEEVPFLGTIPVSGRVDFLGFQWGIWFSDPMNAFYLLAFPLWIVCHQLASNFAKNI